MSTDFTDHGQDPGHPGDRPSPPTTGDPEIDRALEELAAAQTGSLAERIAAGEQAQNALQARLRDLGGA